MRPRSAPVDGESTQVAVAPAALTVDAGRTIVAAPIAEGNSDEILSALLLAARGEASATPVDAEVRAGLATSVHVLVSSLAVLVDQASESRPPHADELASRVADELANPKWDFRTVSGIARALGVERTEVKRVLRENPQLVRWVAATDTHGEQLLVRADRPVTRDERYLALRSALAKSFV